MDLRGRNKVWPDFDLEAFSFYTSQLRPSSEQRTHGVSSLSQQVQAAIYMGDAIVQIYCPISGSLTLTL